MSDAQSLPDWLTRYPAEDWIQAALAELDRARRSFSERHAQAAIAGLKRAAGMALNAALSVHYREDWGRSYVDHLVALSAEASAPDEVRAAAKRLVEMRAPAGQVVSLRTQSAEQAMIEDARTVMAHAYAIAFGSQGRA